MMRVTPMSFVTFDSNSFAVEHFFKTARYIKRHIQNDTTVIVDNRAIEIE